MTVDELAKKLDAKYPGWWITRTLMDEWIVQIKSDGLFENFSGPYIQNVFQQAVDFEFLPLVPPEPLIRNQNDFEIMKNGTHWELLYNRGYCTRFKTKTEAQKAILRWIEIDAQKHAEWSAEYQWCRSKTEGVDFRWGNQ
jgi:hypothetical protein